MRTALMIVLLLALPLAAEAQVSFGVRGGVSVPVGDFADDDPDSEDAGAAEMGYTGGLEAAIWLPFPGLKAIVSADAFVNGFEPSSEGLPPGTEFEVGDYLTIPVLAGLRFGVPLAPTFGIFFTGQAGMAWFRAPDLEISGAGPIGDFTAEFDPVSKFAYSFGVGVSFLGRLEAGLRAYPLGTFEYETEASDGSEVSGEQNVSLIGVTAGIRF